jgi:hypothetical protein
VLSTLSSYNGIKIGTIEGNLVLSDGIKKYRIENDNKVWGLVDNDLIEGQYYTPIGSFKDGKCVDDNEEIIFTIL